MTYFYAPISSIMSKWYNVSYSTVDSRRLHSDIAVTNTLRLLILGGVYSTVVVMRQRACNKRLNSVKGEPYHSTVK